MNTRVSFNLGKLLKNKGYEDTETCYNESGSILTLSPEVKYFYFLGEEFYPAPLIADVVMWLYEKYGVWISVHEYENVFSWGIQKFDLGSVDNFNSPKEAYQNAIEYALTHLVTSNETDSQV